MDVASKCTIVMARGRLAYRLQRCSAKGIGAKMETKPKIKKRVHYVSVKLSLHP